MHKVVQLQKGIAPSAYAVSLLVMHIKPLRLSMFFYTD
jgi:hypothetical protein